MKNSVRRPHPQNPSISNNRKIVAAVIVQGVDVLCQVLQFLMIKTKMTMSVGVDKKNFQLQQH